ncbi:alpha/beta hydrolase [Mycobacterium sp. ML4]
MPAVDRDYYNRVTLADELARARSSAAQADALRAQHPDWAAGNNVPSPNEPGALFDDRVAYEAWQRRYDAALAGTKNLPDLVAVDKTVSGKPDRKLLLLDTQTGRQAHAAIAVGDPDTATHVSVTAPGLNTTVHGAIEGMGEEARLVRDESLRQLARTGHTHETVSAIAWIGYDAPQIPETDSSGRVLAGAWDVSHDDLARAGAYNLAGFYDGIGAAHDGDPAHLTAIGHSYGSLTTGLALQEPGDHGVSDALFYGSPGIEASTPQQLQVQSGHVYVMETPDDPIQLTYDAPPLVHAGAPFLPYPFNVGALGGLSVLDVSGAGQFGPNPATNPEFTRLGTGPVTISDGHGGTLNLEGAHGHSDYPRWGANNLPRTTGYNIAAIVAGLSNRAIPGS